MLILVITNDSAAREAAPWALRFAEALSCPLCLIRPVRREGDCEIEPIEFAESQDSVVQEIRRITAVSDVTSGATPDSTSGDSDMSETALAEAGAGADADGGKTLQTSRGHSIKLLRLAAPDPVAEICRRFQREVELLIVPTSGLAKGPDAELMLERRLFLEADCPTMLFRPSRGDRRDDRRDGVVLVPTRGDSHDDAALELASRLHALPVAALYVQPPGDPDAELVGRRIVERSVRRIAAVHAGDGPAIEPRVVLASSLLAGIETACDSPVQLLLVGIRHHLLSQRPLGSIANRLLERAATPVAVLREATPLRARFWRRCEQWIQDRLPQLTRSERVALVERIQTGSRWNIDFIALICLSTLIAALGLVRNSPAVVIGAMLLAPLMTPLLGAGLSLVQGNWRLVREAADAVARGFLLAFLIGAALGWSIWDLQPSDEMLARGSPNVLDLLVALISGVAAAYAIGRPNLSSALPGVAIAAALVPPIATSGMALAVGEWSLASGALLLFLTNILAIALGAACGLWAVGIRGRHAHGGFERWTWPVVTLLIIGAVALAAYEVRAPFNSQLRTQLEAALRESAPNTTFQSAQWARQGNQKWIEVRITSPTPPPARLASQLRANLESQLPERIRLRVVTVLESTE